MYERKPDRYASVDAGDISKQLEVKERLKCKPFKYFLEVVAPDMLEKYPPVQIEFASGVVSFIMNFFFHHENDSIISQIESVALPNQCIDSLGNFHKPMGFYTCTHDKKHPSGHQHYFLGHHRDIEFYSDSAYCIDIKNNHIELHACHHSQGNQYFRYDLDTQQIKHHPSEEKCLEINENSKRILVKECDVNEIKQRFKWGHVNETNLRNWNNLGAKVIE